MTPRKALAMSQDDMPCAPASRLAARRAERARSRPSAWRVTSANALGSLALLTACGRESGFSLRPPASLDRSQAEALQRMIAAGVTASVRQ